MLLKYVGRTYPDIRAVTLDAQLALANLKTHGFHISNTEPVVVPFARRKTPQD
jgi:hypothetical protein